MEKLRFQKMDLVCEVVLKKHVLMELRVDDVFVVVEPPSCEAIWVQASIKVFVTHANVDVEH